MDERYIETNSHLQPVVSQVNGEEPVLSDNLNLRSDEAFSSFGLYPNASILTNSELIDSKSLLEKNGKLENWEVKWKEIKEIQWETDLGLLVISGKPGSGTSSAAKIVANLYGAHLYKAGDTIREMSGHKSRVSGFIKRRSTIDNAVDAKVRNMTVTAKKGIPTIVEAQIGGLTSLEAIQGLESEGKYLDAPVQQILFWAEKKERLRRLKIASDQEFFERKQRWSETISTGDEEKITEALGEELDIRIGSIDFATDLNIKKLREELDLRESELEDQILQLEALAYEQIRQLNDELLSGTEDEKRIRLSNIIQNMRPKTYKQVEEETTARENDDQDYWRKLYPDEVGEDNPLEKYAKNAKGNIIYSAPVFDNTDWKTPERSAYEVHRYLTRTGLVRPKKEMIRGESVFIGYKPEDNLPETLGINDENPF